ncbi:lymphocyte antigen 75-like [Kryptolebias marmoratus]|uniref:lymphocyte antigen 75-like n=1 Tax=Kryptolebias marmoratus TaxID=37003 RepID=UPI0018ACF98C|nr:lymphocyte antigen 75-like [Kryptolebias marmoratus]
MRNISVFVFLLLILHPVGGQLSGLTLLNFIQYDVEVIWTQAQSICREKHTDLITIRDEQENQAFFPFQGWIGLYRVNNTSPWKWSRGDKEATFYDWDVDEPDSNQHCGFKDSSKYKWRNRDCDRTYTFTCIDEKLVLVKENKTWEEALEHCRSLGGVSSASGLWIHSYDLATLITEDDRNYAREQAKQATTNEVGQFSTLCWCLTNSALVFMWTKTKQTKKAQITIYIYTATAPGSITLMGTNSNHKYFCACKSECVVVN